MPIQYHADSRVFYLWGGTTSYVLHINNDGLLMNLHWGKSIPVGTIHPDYSMYPSDGSFDTQMNYLPHEIPTQGTGWYGTPAVAIRNVQGNDVVELHYVSHEIYSGKKPLNGLPSTYVERADEAESLEILLCDPVTNVYITVVYSVYAQSGVVTRSMRIVNSGAEPVMLTKAMAVSVPLHGRSYDVIHLKGGWAKERSVVRVPVGQSEYRIFSQRGASGHEENPFLAVCDVKTTEHTGEVWSVSFVYSGSFLATATVDNYDNTRLSIGMNPDTFSWHLSPDETFIVPEAVMVYSDAGLNGMSQIYHCLYRTRLVRGFWRDRVRPILINNWEATYFDFTQDKLLAIAQQAQALGIELFVLDDGWFGNRNNDRSSLGDWVVNRQKLPEGIDGLAARIHQMGMQFGLWFEPEMVSPDSNLYRAHPDWCLHVTGRKRTEARNQLVLDLSREEVQDYIIKTVSTVLHSASIDYVKWDMNRNMTEAFSGKQIPERQKETQHRYMLGLYAILDALTNEFPQILFESCSGGGGRFDPGMLYYMPQTWTSDNTDAVERLSIQYGTSFVYPASTMCAHVSAIPNHQCGRMTSLSMRGDVALGGNFGYELDLSAQSEEDLKSIRNQIERMKRIRSLTQQGTFTRLLSPFDGHYVSWQFVAEKQDEVLLCVYRILTKPNTPALLIRMKNLDSCAEYSDEEGNIYHGQVLMNMGIWIQLKEDFSSKVICFHKVQTTTC